MSKLDWLPAIEDLKAEARRRMPRFAFDWLDGGAESEAGLRRNEAAFNDILLQPRYLRDVSEIRSGVSLFGKDYAAPLGVSPVGFMNMAWPGTDQAVARMARAQRIPIVASTAASSPMESFAELAEDFAWFQLYVSDDVDFTAKLVERARAAGFEVLVVTVDVSAPGKRDRDVRSGVRIPFKITPRIFLDLALHPGWSFATLRHGAPNIANLMGHWGGIDRPMTVEEQQKMLISTALDWEKIRRLRDAWPGKLLLKGILHPEDAVLAFDVGCDGIVVSNHGGRQADYAPAPIEVLPEIVKAVAGCGPVLIDGGVRRGADLVKAKALGADFAFAGRPFAYGTAAAGLSGATHAFEILTLELRRALGQIGCPDFNAVDASVLWRPGDAH